MNKPDRLAKQLEIVKIGSSAAVILPKELLDRLELNIGDFLSIGLSSAGVSLVVEDPEFEHQMAEARSIMKRYRNALSELAK